MVYIRILKALFHALRFQTYTLLIPFVWKGQLCIWTWIPFSYP